MSRKHSSDAAARKRNTERQFRRSSLPASTTIYRPQRCGKVAYPSKALAKEVQRRRERDGVDLHVYECAECRRWHLSSMAPEFVRRGEQ